MKVLDSGVVRESRDAVTQKNGTTMKQSVCNIKERIKRLLILKSSFQLSTALASKEGVWRVSSPIQNCTAQRAISIAPTHSHDCRSPDMTEIDSPSILQKSPKATGSNHHRYTNRNCNTGSTMVEGGCSLPF